VTPTAKLAQEAFKGFTDAEVSLMILALNAGARFRSDILGSGLAVHMTAVAVDMAVHELKRRELDPSTCAMGLLERLLDQMPKE
jgi:hypothetical protein